ncbi:hypothetical protein ES703_117181 [subsurface metagenome]
MVKEESQKLAPKIEDILDAILRTPKGEAVLDAIFDWLEANTEGAARGIDLIIEKMQKEGKWPPKAKD